MRCWALLKASWLQIFISLLLVLLLVLLNSDLLVLHHMDHDEQQGFDNEDNPSRQSQNATFGEMAKTPCLLNHEVALGRKGHVPDVQEHPDLLEFIKKNVFRDVGQELWAENKAEANFTDGISQLAKGVKDLVIPKFLSKIVASGRQGTFADIGARSTCSGDSTTYYLEQKLGWSGLLVEPSSNLEPKGDLFSNARHCKRSRSKVAAVCVGPQRSPCKGRIQPIMGSVRFSHMVAPSAKTSHNPTNTTWSDCYPLTSLLLAAGLAQVDFLSIDVEFLEHHILETVNWDVIKPKVIRLDDHLMHKGPSWKNRLNERLAAHGYKYHPEVRTNAYMHPDDSNFYTLIEDWHKTI